MLKRKTYYLLLILVILISYVVPDFVQSSTVYAATNQEKINGIEYVNKDLGFSLTLPESWKGKYSVEANETSASFKVKLDYSYNEKYNNIYLFTIWADDKESSETGGGEDFPIGNKNGKYYSISVDHALYRYDDYDEMFPEATEEERKTIEMMFKQIKEIGQSFKMLDKKDNGKWEIPKASTKNLYDFESIKITRIGDEEVSFAYIKTPISNIRTEVIKKPVSATNYIGINGGFNSQGNGIEGRSISFYNPAMVTDGSTEIHNFNSKENPIKKPESIYSLPTFVTYYDKDLKTTKAEIISAKSMNDIYNHFKNLDHNDHHHHSNQIIINAIGGKGYDINHWGGRKKAYFEDTLRRTILAYKEENGTIYAYLIITTSFVTVERLKLHVEKLGFKKDEHILLDGSGSTSMRAKIKKHNGKWEWYVDKGSEGVGLLSYFFVYALVESLKFLNKDIDLGIKNPADRKVYNMIRLIDEPS